MFPAYLNDGATWTRLSERAELSNTGGSIMQAATFLGLNIDAGHTYVFGLKLKTYEDAVSPVALAKATVTWTCVYN
jgi:hypothetical protein